MVKRFQKGKFYTLCLVQEVNDEVHTWTVNVQYKSRMGSVLEFTSLDDIYTVDLDDRLVHITTTEIIYYYNQDISQYEYDELEKIYTVGLTNIVAGWQY